MLSKNLLTKLKWCLLTLLRSEVRTIFHIKDANKSILSYCEQVTAVVGQTHPLHRFAMSLNLVKLLQRFVFQARPDLDCTWSTGLT